MIKKYNYSQFEQAKIYEIFAKHNVKFECESLEDSQRALNEILSTTLESLRRKFVFKESAITVRYKRLF